MKKTYKYRLPKDAEVSQASVRVENGEVFVDVELKDKFEPKDGDFVVDDEGEVFILWEKGNTPYSHGAYVCIDNRCKELNEKIWNYSIGERYATEQEKSDFLEQLEKEYGRRWNPEKKCLEDTFEPKDGDFLAVRGQAFIYNGCKGRIKEDGADIVTLGAHAGVAYNGSIKSDIAKDMWARLKDCRYATEEEKKELLEMLEKAGFRWNPETKKTDKISWRAEKKEHYYCFNGIFEVVEMTEIREGIDEKLYNAGNYFRTPEEAQKIADKIKEMLRKEE